MSSYALNADGTVAANGKISGDGAVVETEAGHKIATGLQYSEPLESVLPDAASKTNDVLGVGFDATQIGGTVGLKVTEGISGSIDDAIKGSNEAIGNIAAKVSKFAGMLEM